MLQFFSHPRPWCAAVLSAFILFVPFSAFAATTVSDAYDQPTTLVAGSSGNHHVSLTLNGTWSEGETLTLSFESGFNLSSLTEDDVDLADDALDLTTATDCSGSEQASMVRSSQTVTFTLCAGDGGSMASGSVVDIEIGLNASSSGIGSSQIRNPLTEGTHYIQVGGTLGQVGSIPVPIISRDASGVSATVGTGDDPGDPGCASCGGTENRITVESPNGGETYSAGDTVTLSWSTTGSGISSVHLFYSIDGGSTYTNIVYATVNDGLYTWTVPDVTTTQARIYAQGTDGIDLVDTDTSDDDFAINGSESEVPTMHVVRPNGGEIYFIGDVVSVAWETAGGVGSVTILFSSNNGLSWTTLSSEEENDGAYQWTISETITAGTDYLIEVIGFDGAIEVDRDTSDDPFSIMVPSEPPVSSEMITVEAPNGGEVYTAATTETILWESSGAFDSVNILYSVDNGVSFSTIANGVTNDGSYNWTVVSLSTTQALIRVDGMGGATVVSDTSDSVFTILLAPSDEDTITVLAPNGGESFAGGTVTEVTWLSTGDALTGVDLAYSLDGGTSWSSIVTNTSNDGSYSWIAPLFATTQALVRVVGVGGTTAYSTDTSDAVFTITLEEVPPPETTSTLSTRFLVAHDLLSLMVDEETVDVLANEPVDVVVDLSRGTDVVSVVVSYLDMEYRASLVSETSWKTSFTASDPTTAPLGIVVTYADGTSLAATYTVTIVSRAEVYENSDGIQTPVADVVLLAYDTTSGTRMQWDAVPYGFSNPDISGTDGTFGWYVPNGTYVVAAGKSGYSDTEYPVTVWNNILAPTIEMSRTEEPVIVPPEIFPEDDSSGSPSTTPSVTQETAPSQTWIAYAVMGLGLDVVQEAFASPAGQTTADIAEPIAFFSAVTGGVLLLSLLDIFPLLQYIFSAPLLFFARRRRQSFGVVYNGITKVPVDLAIVRLLNTSGKILRTMVTDKEGRYFFKVDPGTYVLSVTKRGCVFPSAYVGSARTDGSYLDVYTGGEIQVTERDVLLTANIPIDPADTQKKHQARFLRLGRFLRSFQEVVALSGVGASLMVAFLRPSLWTIGLCLMNVGIYFAVRLFVRAPKPKGWGMVFHEQKKKKLGNVIVRLFEPKYNKLIESTLTDRQGRYAFLVGPNAYYVTFEKEGFKKREIRSIDFTKNTTPELLSVDVSMSKEAGEV